MSSLILNTSQQFVTFQLWYIEEKDDKHGFVSFYFINSKEKQNEWREKGYLTQDEYNTAIENYKEPKPGGVEKSKPDPNKIIKILKTWWSRLSWKQQNEINSACLKQVSFDEDTKLALDGVKYMDMKLKSCLKKWDLIDDETKQEIPVTSEKIDNLVPEVAQELLTQFEKITELRVSDVKNSKR